MKCRESILIGERPSARVREITLDDFVIEAQIGKGHFGRVYLTTLPSTGQQYAMKSIRKDKILAERAL